MKYITKIYARPASLALIQDHDTYDDAVQGGRTFIDEAGEGYFTVVEERIVYHSDAKDPGAPDTPELKQVRLTGDYEQAQDEVYFRPIHLEDWPAYQIDEGTWLIKIPPGLDYDPVWTVVYLKDMSYFNRK